MAQVKNKKPAKKSAKKSAKKPAKKPAKKSPAKKPAATLGSRVMSPAAGQELIDIVAKELTAVNMWELLESDSRKLYAAGLITQNVMLENIGKSKQFEAEFIETLENARHGKLFLAGTNEKPRELSTGRDYAQLIRVLYQKVNDAQISLARANAVCNVKIAERQLAKIKQACASQEGCEPPCDKFEKCKAGAEKGWKSWVGL